MLNLHNLTEEVANTQTERAGRMGEVSRKQQLLLQQCGDGWGGAGGKGSADPSCQQQRTSSNCSNASIGSNGSISISNSV